MNAIFGQTQFSIYVYAFAPFWEALEIATVAFHNGASANAACDVGVSRGARSRAETVARWLIAVGCSPAAASQCDDTSVPIDASTALSSSSDPV